MKWKTILFLGVIMMLSNNVNALCLNPLELFCIFSEPEIGEISKDFGTGTEMSKGTIIYTGDYNYIKYDNKIYSVDEALKIYSDKERYYIETIDGLKCDFIWDTPTSLAITKDIIDFKQGKFSDIKCNQQYKYPTSSELIQENCTIKEGEDEEICNEYYDNSSQLIRNCVIKEGINEEICDEYIKYTEDTNILNFDSGWIVDIDPSITHTSSTDFTGIYNQTNSSTLTTSLVLDNITSTSYYSSGDYISGVIGAGASVQWDTLNWSTSGTTNYTNSTSFLTTNFASDNSYGLAFDSRDNSFWIADYTDAFVYHVYANGTNITNGGFSMSGTKLINTPRGITLDTTTNSFWITDNVNDVVSHMYSNGTNITDVDIGAGFNISSSGLDTSMGIAFDSRDNTLWITDYGDMFVYHFYENGTNITDGGFSTSPYYCYGLAFDSRDNSFWIVDATVDYIYNFYSNGTIREGFNTLMQSSDEDYSLTIDSDYSIETTDLTDFRVYTFRQPSIKFQATSCADSGCADGTFVGPDNTSSTYFTSNASLNSTLTPNNRYFQYKSFLFTPNIDVTPYLESVDVSYTVAADTCTYTSGNWNVVFSDNCTISSNVIGGGNNLNIIGDNGIFILDANISGFTNIHADGANSIITQRLGSFK